MLRNFLKEVHLPLHVNHLVFLVHWEHNEVVLDVDGLNHGIGSLVKQAFYLVHVVLKQHLLLVLDVVLLK